MNHFLQALGFKVNNGQGLREAIDLSFCYAKFSPNGQLQECNTNFASLLNYESPDEIIGQHHGIFVDEAYRSSNEYLTFWNDLEQGKVQSGEFQRKRKDNKIVYIQAAYTPLFDKKGKVIHVVKIASDITVEKVESNKSMAIKNTIDLSFAFIQFDPQGKIIEANENFIRTMGYTSKDSVVGKHHSIFVTEHYKKSDEYVRFWEKLRQGHVQTGEFHRVAKNGKDIWLQASYAPVKDYNGKVLSVVKIATDITLRKKSFDQAQILKKTIDLSFGFIQFDVNGVIQQMNNNFSKLMGYASQSELIGKHHSVFVSKKYAESQEYLTFWKTLGQGTTQQNEFERIDKNGNKVWIQAAYTPVLNDQQEVISVIKIAADVTKTRREANNAKKELQSEVIGNVKEIAVAIDQIASGARTQATKTDESSEKIEVALKSSMEMASKAEIITEAASIGAASSQDGGLIIAHMVETMNALKQVAAKTQESMTMLANRTQDISNALNAIQDIAAQTNLLALNASIEAAQAGDSGRGFGVIANEVRALAENSKKSAKEIENMISSINQDTVMVSKAMNDVAVKVKEGGEETMQVNDIFKKMSTASNQTLQLSGDILTAALNQRSDIKSLLGNIESIVVVANQTAAGADEVLAAAHSLEKRIDSF